MTKITAFADFSTEFTAVAPKITWAWHLRVKTVAGFHRSDIRPFRINTVLTLESKMRSKSVGRNKNGLLPYEINPEQSD